MFIPLAAIFWRGLLVNMQAYFDNPSLGQAVWLSLSTSLVSSTFILLTGTPLAYILSRWRSAWKAPLELMLDLPIVLPPLIAGIGLLLAFGRNGLLGSALNAAGLRLAFTTSAVVIAQTVVAAPLFIRAARLGFSAIEPQLAEAAYTEGATEWQLFRHIMLPLAWRAILSGLILSWARGFGEFGATIVFAGNLEGRTQTIPLAIFVGFESNLGLAIGLSILLLGISAVVLLILRGLENAAYHGS